MTFTEMNEGVRSTTTSTVAERFADGADDRIRLPRVELSGHNFRAAESVAYGYGFGESMGAEKDAAYSRLPGKNGSTGSALRARSDDEDVSVFFHE